VTPDATTASQCKNYARSVETEPGSTYSALLYAPRRFRLNYAISALIICATPTIIVALAIGFPWGFVALGVGCASAMVSAGRAFRIRLLITEASVRIDNYWRSYEFAWSDVKVVRIGLKNQGVLPQPALGFGLNSGEVRFAQATPLRANERQQFQAAVLALAPSSVQALPDTAGIIGSEKALTVVIRQWWMKGQPARRTNRIEGDRMVWIEQPLFAPLSRHRKSHPEKHSSGPEDVRR
jgi:hypothetical protein